MIPPPGMCLTRRLLPSSGKAYQFGCADSSSFGRDADSEETEKLVAELLEKDSSLEGLFALYALCRIAEPGEINTRAKQFATRMRHISYSDNELFGNLANLDVLAGGKEEECLEKAGDSASRYVTGPLHDRNAAFSLRGQYRRV